MERAMRQNRSAGFTLIELLVSLVIGSFLVTALFQIWNTNRKETDRIQTKADYRDRATLATTALNRSITMAGFGLSKLDVISRVSGSLTDTLKLYSNAEERRTTLRDTARIGSVQLTVFKDSGFTVGTLIGITDSLKQEYVRLTAISGDASSGFRFTVSPALGNAYLPGVPDIYPVQKETFYIDHADSVLVRLVDSRRIELAQGITEFRVDLRDGSGAPATKCKNIRVITFSLTGSYKAPTGAPSQMSFSSTVIPRNIL
jgi:prepilin-type N-terminal cleavage/methylation domain-containing protein